MLPFYSKLTSGLQTVVRLNKFYNQRFLSLSSQCQQKNEGKQDIKFVIKGIDEKQAEKYNSSLEKQYYRKQDTNYQKPQPEIEEEPVKQDPGFVRSKSALDKRACKYLCLLIFSVFNSSRKTRKKFCSLTRNEEN